MGSPAAAPAAPAPISGGRLSDSKVNRGAFLGGLMACGRCDLTRGLEQNRLTTNELSFMGSLSFALENGRAVFLKCDEAFLEILGTGREFKCE